MSKEKQSQLCPFKKIIERDYSGRTGKATINERFAPCAGNRCMAYIMARHGGGCRRLGDTPPLGRTP